MHGSVAPAVEQQTEQDAHLVADHDAQLPATVNMSALRALELMGRHSDILASSRRRPHTKGSSVQQPTATTGSSGMFLRTQSRMLGGAIGTAVTGVVLVEKVVVPARPVPDDVGVARTGQLLSVCSIELATMKRLALMLEEESAEVPVRSHGALKVKLWFVLKAIAGQITAGR